MCVGFKVCKRAARRQNNSVLKKKPMTIQFTTILLLLIACVQPTHAIWDPYAAPEDGGRLFLNETVTKTIARNNVSPVNHGSFSISLYGGLPDVIFCLFFELNDFCVKILQI
jgi:hypothetical protein